MRKFAVDIEQVKQSCIEVVAINEDKAKAIAKALWFRENKPKIKSVMDLGDVGRALIFKVVFKPVEEDSVLVRVSLDQTHHDVVVQAVDQWHSRRRHTSQILSIVGLGKEPCARCGKTWEEHQSPVTCAYLEPKG
jgi:hypothetical protein